MSIVEIVAIETSGVREEDELIEWAYGRYITGGKGLVEISTQIINPSPKLNWQDTAVAHHTKSGLLPELLKGKGGAFAMPPFVASNLRVVWKRHWAKDFVGPMQQVLANAHNADHLIRYCEVIRDTQIFDRPIRAVPKVELIAKALCMLENPKECEE